VREAAHSSCSLIGIFCAIVPPAGASKAESGTAQRARRSQPVQAGSAPGGRRSQKALNVDGERHTCTMGRACKLGGGQNVAFWKRWCVPSARWPANALWQCSLALYASQSSRSGVLAGTIEGLCHIGKGKSRFQNGPFRVRISWPFRKARTPLLYFCRWCPTICAPRGRFYQLFGQDGRVSFALSLRKLCATAQPASRHE